MDNLLTLFDYIGALARLRYQTGERYFAQWGLNHTEGRLLRLLSQEGGETTQDVLSSLIYIDRTNTGRALKSLEQGGFIARHRSETDKRTNLVLITDKGRQTISELMDQRNGMIRGFFGDLTNDEAAIIVKLLEKVLAHEYDA